MSREGLSVARPRPAGLGAGIGLAVLLKMLISRFGVDLSGTSLVISPLTPAAAYAYN
ncbi:MAG: hypothetical protein ACJ8DJ_17930 [Gemmatimonadales bacterium]|jgi:hypothetical protein